MSEKQKPNFLIIGSQKCGTTSIHHYLSQHPEIYMSKVKEPNYFCSQVPHKSTPYSKRKNGLINRLYKIAESDVSSYEEYLNLFSGAKNEKIRGESSAAYIESSNIGKEIHKCLPNVKMLLIIRNPADRAFSHFLQNYRYGAEKSFDFKKALSKEKYRAKYFYRHQYIYNYFERGLYYKKIKSYLDIFDKKQILIILYENFKLSPHKTLKEVFDFLEVNNSFQANITSKHNITGVPKNKAAYKVLGDIYANFFRNKPLSLNIDLLKPIVNNFALTPAPTLENETREELLSRYNNDIKKLEGLIGQDLSIWK